MKTLYTDGLLKFNAFFLEDVLKVEQVEEPEMEAEVPPADAAEIQAGTEGEAMPPAA